ncbi:hypothetical protein NLI96_g9368 [Meripilus lineatus]|uniref:DUF7923 domain-containing protein n=1 Tax=Meripilus lineatus TaxID=2056292 RepID=A0AAD5UVJ6_9APHY|nr:hypothetical protein NLI96_g9368 [Physisporinus lineatus]
MLSTVRQISVFCSSIHSRIVSDGPCLVLETGKFNALLDKQKRHDQLARNLKTQLDIEGRGFRSIQEELEARTQEWEEIKRDYDRELLSLKDLERQSQGHIQYLEAQIRTLKGLERRVVCLIDGDGTIFSQELLALGEQGGHAAARELTRLILEYLKGNFTQSPSSPELSVYIFLHKRGLMDALGMAGYHNEKAKFDDFIAGFNQAGQRFMMVDVGAGKENADSKLRAFLQDSIRSPQTWKVFFGGSHDNGYAPDLQSLITDGFREKLILLPGYTQIASRIADLGFPVLAIHGIFMPDKLPSFKSPPSRPSHFGLLPILDKTEEDPEIQSVNSSPATPKSARKTAGNPSTPSKIKKGAKVKATNAQRGWIALI